MIFHEIYGKYYQTVTKILTEAGQGGITGNDMFRIVQAHAFGESTMVIPDALKSEKWMLLKKGLRSVLSHTPTMPVTTLEKRWLKSLLLDKRIQLFSPSSEGLEDVEPLYHPEDFVFFDRYADADPYGDPEYAAHFRTILTAIREHRELVVDYASAKSGVLSATCLPHHLEYSRKDDKFRLVALQQERPSLLNLARIQSCTLGDIRPDAPDSLPPFPEKKLILELTDERNALERTMLHFSHLKKETIRLEENRYQVTLYYRQYDESELLIRVLSFGPMLKVISPDNFAALIRERLQKQKNLRTS